VRLSQGTELLHWFEQQCNQANNDLEIELRLESDSDLIRVITQHGSKGMEYPYVFIPFATRHKDPLTFGNKSVSYIEYHDEKGNLCLSLDGSNEAKAAMSREAYAESIRLLYVAITRAEQRCYVFCCAFDAYHLSPLGKTLSLVEPIKSDEGCLKQESILSALQTIQSQAPNDIGIRQVELDGDDCSLITLTTDLSPNMVSHPPQLMNTGVMPCVSQFTGKIERDWWLSSFSALSRNMRHAGVSLPDRDMTTTSLDSMEYTVQNKMCFKLAKGAHTGNLLHDILEHTDFSDPDWHTSLEKPLLTYGELKATGNHLNTSLTRFTPDDLIEWLEVILSTPFITGGSLTTVDIELNHDKNTGINAKQSTEQSAKQSTEQSSKKITEHNTKQNPELPDSQQTVRLGCLADLTMQYTLRESEFYFPMQGQGTIALAKLLTDHRNRAERNKNKLNQNYQQPVTLPNYQQLSGMMHGFIDLIFEYNGKYYLCDYKSNHLGDHFYDYQYDSLLNNIEQNYYDLQYLIYALALHKYLQQTLMIMMSKNILAVFIIFI
jgi:exodeoxyribonuclease V beta subunit